MKRAATILLIIMGSAGRLCAQADGGTADQYERFFKYYVGRWDVTMSSGETGTCIWEVSPHKKCREARLTLDGQLFTHGLEGYDPSEKCWKSFAWYADGGHGIATTRLDASALQTGPVAGMVIEAKWSRVNADGTKEELTFTNKILGPDEWEFHSGDTHASLKRSTRR